MTTIIANPIYDAVFKFLMEDQKVAKILLSALLKKEILELEMRRHEYTSMEKTRISLFRIDFSARVRDADGTENLILIELQKTWLITETFRFRQYLGTQYLNKENIVSEKLKDTGKEVSFGLPIVSIYILGHSLGEFTEPVIYVRHRYLDYNDNLLSGPDRFIESLTHDSIVVQIPFLTGHTRNRLERILSVFDQEYCKGDNEHYLEIDDESFEGDDVQFLVHRLLKAAATPDVRRAMEIEDEIYSEIETRDATIMQKDQEIEQKDQEIEQRNQAIEQKDQEIEQKDQAIEQKEQAIEQRNQAIEQKQQEIEQRNQAIEQKEQEIEQKDQEIEQKDHILRSMVKMLCQQGITPEDIAAQLSIPVEQIRHLINKAID